MPVLRGRLARADHALRRAGVIADTVWDMFVDWLAAGHQSDARDDLHPVARARARRARAAARHDHAGRLARAGADLQGPAAEARRSRPLELRFPRLSGDAGRRHPDLSREHGAGGRGPGLARRARARDRAPLQPHLRPRARLRGQGEGGGEEAGREEGAPLRGAAHRVPGAAATSERSRPRASC